MPHPTNESKTLKSTCLNQQREERCYGLVGYSLHGTIHITLLSEMITMHHTTVMEPATDFIAAIYV